MSYSEWKRFGSTFHIDLLVFCAQVLVPYIFESNEPLQFP